PKAASTALASEDSARAALVPLLAEQGLAPGTVAELASAIGADAGVVRKVLTKLVAEGAVVRLGPDLHFDAATVVAAREKIVAYLHEHGTILAKDARDITGSSRKYIVPLLEYFDSQGVTKRDGDERTLGKRG
ncbi:MAG: SelB C-terminal domain-containing protein, partial [Coriobacteriia bacterium]